MKNILLLTLLLPSLLFANPGKELVALLDKITSMQANFVQEPLGESHQFTEKTSGKMALQKPGKFRWEIKKPGEELIIADGEKLWYYIVDLEQVTVQKQSTGIGNSPATILSGKADGLLTLFDITNKKTNEPGKWYVLKLKANETESFSNIELYFINDTLQKMRLTDNLGQESLVTFSDIINNPSLNNNIFVFSIPKGVDLIER